MGKQIFRFLVKRWQKVASRLFVYHTRTFPNISLFLYQNLPHPKLFLAPSARYRQNNSYAEEFQQNSLKKFKRSTHDTVYKPSSVHFYRAKMATEYVLNCKLFLRLFGLYFFENDSKRRRLLTNAWMFFCSGLFLLTAIQALVQLLSREGFDLTNDCFGILTFCESNLLLKSIKLVIDDFSCQNGSLLPHPLLLLQKGNFAWTLRLYVASFSVQQQHRFGRERYEALREENDPRFNLLDHVFDLRVRCGTLAFGCQGQVRRTMAKDERCYLQVVYDRRSAENWLAYLTEQEPRRFRTKTMTIYDHDSYDTQ